MTPSSPNQHTPREDRVLVVTQAFERHYTGWAKHTVKLLEELGRSSAEAEADSPPLRFSLLTSREEVQSSPTVIDEALVTPVYYGESGRPKLASGLALIAYFLATFHRWDVVYFSNFYFPVPLLVLLADLLGCRAVVRIAGQEVTASGWRGAIRDQASRRADAVVVLNASVQQYLVVQGVAEQAIHFIPNAVNLNTYAPNGARYDRSATVQHLLCVAAVCERKGVHHVVEAMSQVRERAENAELDLHLTVVGPYNEGESTSEYTEKLEALITSHGLGDAVTFAGRVDDVVPYYREADVFLLPSYQEGMPNVLLEAMACSLPCIATAIPGVVDVVDDGETALLVEPGSDEDLTGALRRLMKNPDLVRRLRRNARAAVEERHSLEHMAASYRGVMRSALPARRSGASASKPACPSPP